jgi:hypothetical protein
VVQIGKEKKRVDWNAVHAEYIGGGISQRKLAEKYGVTYPMLRSRADHQGWVTEREETKRRLIAEASRKTAAAASNNAEIAARIKSKLLRKLEKEIDALPDMVGSETRNSVVERSGGKGKSIIKEAAKAYKLRDLAAAYKDLTADMMTTETEANPLLQSLYDLERRCQGD